MTLQWKMSAHSRPPMMAGNVVDRMRKSFSHLIHVMALIVLITPHLAYAQMDSEEEAPNTEATVLATAKPKAKPKTLMMPQMSFRAKDGKLLAQLMQKNKWFQQFRGTSFYQGATYKIAPVLFATPDDFGQSKDSWQGHLLGYVYEKLLEERPVTLNYYRRPRLASPYVVTVNQLSKTEVSAAQTLIKSLRSHEPVTIETEAKVSVAVTPLLVKQQKFAVALEGSCLSVGRSPEAVAAAVTLCERTQRISADAEVQISLDESFPALKGLREKFLGVMPEAELQFKWKEPEARFVAMNSQIDLIHGEHLLLKAQMPESFLQALPSSAIFFSSGFVPKPALGFAPEQIEGYLKSAKLELRKSGALPVALTYFSVEQEGKAPDAHPAILIHYPNATAETLTQLSQTFSGRGRNEVYIRRICTSVVAVSNAKVALDHLEKVCNKKLSSFSQMPDRFVTALKGKQLSNAVYLNPGRLLSMQIEKGWRSKQKLAPANEIKLSQKIVEDLPKYVFTGTAGDKRLVMKAIE